MNKMTIALATLFAISQPAISLAAEPVQSAKPTTQIIPSQPFNQRNYKATEEKSRSDCEPWKNPETGCREINAQNNKRRNSQSDSLESSRP
jgi:hypothetical protein